MAEFFVVYGQSVGNKSNPKNNQEKHGSTEYEANPEECKFVKVKTGSAGAAGIKEAQAAVNRFFQGDVTNTPIVVTKAAWEKASGGGSTNYFVLFTQQSMGRRFTLPEKYESAELLEQSTAETESIGGQVFEGNFIKIKAAGEEEARAAIMRHFQGDITTKPITVTEAAWKSS